MEEEAQARKQRMRALREAAAAKGEVETEEKTIKFRNYTPKDEELKGNKVEAAKPEQLDDVEIEVTKGDEDVQQPGSVVSGIHIGARSWNAYTSMSIVQGSLLLISTFGCWCLQEELLSVAPKKANWDLKRDVAKQLEKLERRTQKAVVEIVREQHGEATAA